MLKVGIIGCGNAGNQTVAACMRKYPEIPCLAINCSDKDMATIPNDVPKRLIGDGRGAGKNRDEAKKFLAQKIGELTSDKEFTDMFGDLDIVFIVSSCGGGTGSGTSLLLASIMKKAFAKCFPVTVGILPALSEGYSTQGNALEYLHELYNVMENPTYMLYDNDNGRGLPTNKMMEAVNEQIIDDIDVIRGSFNIATPYSSIDEKDSLTLFTTPGRIAIASLRDIKEKEASGGIEDLLIAAIKKSYHVSLQRDKVVNRTGIIATLSSSLMEEFDDNIPRVKEMVGSAVEEFVHLALTPERTVPNRLFFVMTGLSKISDRIREINDRVAEIENAQHSDSADEDLNKATIQAINSKKFYRDSESGKKSGKIDISGTLKDFGVDIDSLQ